MVDGRSKIAVRLNMLGCACGICRLGMWNRLNKHRIKSYFVVHLKTAYLFSKIEISFYERNSFSWWFRHSSVSYHQRSE